MILASVWFLANRHILLAIGDLQEIQIRRQKGHNDRQDEQCVHFLNLF